MKPGDTVKSDQYPGRTITLLHVEHYDAVDGPATRAVGVIRPGGHLIGLDRWDVLGCTVIRDN